MKKKFTILIAAIAAILMMALPEKVVGQTKTDPTFTFTQNSNTYGWSGTPADGTDLAVNDVFTNGNITFTYTAKGSGSTHLRWWSITDGLRSYKGNKFKIATSEGTIESITFTGSCILAESSSTGGTISNNHDWTKPAEGSVTEVEFLCNQSSGNKTIKTVTVTIATGGGGGSSAVATTTTITAQDGFNTDLKNGTTAGTLTATVTETESGDDIDGATVTWESSDPDVATINESGVVTLVAVGTTTITASYAGVEDEYEASSDEYELEVVDSRYTVSDLTFTAACEGSGTADDGAEWEITSDADESIFDSNRGIHYGTSSANVTYVRLTTTDIEGIIKRVVINASDAQGASTISVTVGGEAFTCTGSTTVTNSNPGVDYTFNGSGNGEIVVLLDRGSAQTKAIYVKSVKVTYQEVAVKDPVITVPDSFIGSTTATITCGTAGATIKYNYDGGSIWNTYSTSLNITETTTIYAKATKGEDESSVVSKTTTKNYNVNIDNLTHGTITATPTVAAEGIEITLTITPEDCYQLKPNTLIVVDDELNEITVTNNKFDMPGSNVLVSAEFEAITYTVHYSVNGVVGELEDDLVNCGEDAYLYDADDLEDAGVSLPTGCSFAGWSANPASTAVVSSFYPDADATLYAVLSQSSGSSNYVKVTKDLTDWSGEYLIVYEDGNLAFDGSLLSLDAVGNTQLVTITNETIASSTTIDSYCFTIASVTGGYSIQSASGYYIGQTSDANGLATSDETYYTNFITYDSENNTTLISSSSAVLRYNSASNQTRFRYYKSSTYTAQNAIQLYKKQTSTNYTRIEDITTTTATLPSIEPTYLITVMDGGVLTLTGNNNGTAANLIIEEGGQIILPEDASVSATIKRSVKGNAKAAEWEAFASTINNPAIGSTNLITGTYDLYMYDEAATGAEWRNYKANTGAFANLANSRGYLYRNAATMDITITGSLNTSDISTYTLSRNSEDTNIKGFNFVGNPYQMEIYKGVAISNEYLETGYYVLEKGGWAVKDDNVAIAPGAGILVQAKDGGHNQALDITYTGASAKANHDNIMFTVKNSEYSDVAYAMFDKGHGLNKIEHRNANIPMLYIPQNGERFAIAMMDDNTQMFDLSFKAMTTGKYTISMNAIGNFSYIHLIDRLTGDDTNLLIEDYSFIGSPQDNAERFIVKLSYDNGSSTDSETFAYQSGNEIIVNGEGTLEVYDVTGRKVMSTNINGIETINGLNSGVYIFRVIGETLKTQKIVVR